MVSAGWHQQDGISAQRCQPSGPPGRKNIRATWSRHRCPPALSLQMVAVMSWKLQFSEKTKK